MILILSKLALAGSLFFLIGFVLMFTLTVLAAGRLQAVINKAQAEGKGLIVTLTKMEHDALINAWAGRIGFSFLWAVGLGLISLLLWIVA